MCPTQTAAVLSPDEGVNEVVPLAAINAALLLGRLDVFTLSSAIRLLLAEPPIRVPNCTLIDPSVLHVVLLCNSAVAAPPTGVVAPVADTLSRLLVAGAVLSSSSTAFRFLVVMRSL